MAPNSKHNAAMHHHEDDRENDLAAPSLLVKEYKALASWTSDSHCKFNGEALTVSLGLTHDCHVLFEGASFSLSRGQVTGLVGTNGSGKTSLAMVLASRELPGFPKDMKVTYLASEDDELLRDDTVQAMTPSEYILHSVHRQIEHLTKEIERLEALLEDEDNGDLDEETAGKLVEQLSDLYDASDSLQESSQREIQQILEVDLSFGPHLHKQLSQLSSGWRYKCRLAAALLTTTSGSSNTLLIVDEPSFLDTASTAWFVQRLQQAAKQQECMILLISHKEALLEAACDDHILYINAANKSLTQYHCGYETFRQVHAHQVAASRRAVDQAKDRVVGADKELHHVQQQLRKREKNMKQTTTENADRRFIKGKNKEAKQKADKSAASKVKQLKKQQAAIQEQQQQMTITDRVKPIIIQGNVAQSTLAVLEDVTVSFEGFDVFENVEARLEPTDKILLAGPNGCGKSTLIQLLLGNLQASRGSCRLASSTIASRTIYFPQTALNDLLRRHGQETAMSYLASNEELTETQLRQQLGNFGLTRDIAKRTVASLSAGQHVRLWLAKQLLTQTQPSLLILDEISENVDVDTRQSLTDLSNTFDGAVLVVSHDADFVEAYQPTQIWNLYPQGIHIQYPEPT